MQDENKFNIEKLKDFKSEKTFIYIKKSIYKLKN